MGLTKYREWWMDEGCPVFSPLEMSDTLDLLGRPRTILTSGGYSPIHPGHISCIQASAKLGTLIVVVNDDNFLVRKRGRAFMPLEVRCQVLSMIKGVGYVVPFKPSRLNDDTVCEALSVIKPDIFTKGGDRNISNIPEADICKTLGIKIIDGMGEDKYWSSSAFLDLWESHCLDKYIRMNNRIINGE